MKKQKLLLTVGIIMVLVIAVAAVSYAASYGSPAEALASLTGQDVEDVIAARQDGESYGEQAEAAGVLDQFHAYREELFKTRLDEWVADDRITQEEADERLAAMEDREALCDGTGIGGGGFGMGQNGSGYGDGSGEGNGQRRGGGGFGSGSCIG